MSRIINIPLPVKYSLEKLGKDINRTRRRRGISKQLMAERAGIAINTLTKLENGNPGTTMATLGSVLFVLDMMDNLKNACDLKNDEIGMMYEDERLPKRIRKRKVINE